MNINRQNYEVWFVDFLDGNLDEQSRRELFAFLKDNPDLAKELDQFAEISLDCDNVSFNGKERLFKSEADLIGIEYPDYLLIKRIEEGLSIKEEAQLNNLITDNVNLINRDAEFQQTRLIGEKILFPGKEKLLRKQVNPLFTFVKRTVVAASLLVMIFFGYKMFNRENQLTRTAMVPLDPIRNVHFEDVQIISNSLVPISQKQNEPNTQLAHIKEMKPNQAVNAKNLKDTYFGQDLPENAPVLPLVANYKTTLLPVEIPNAYETGLRHMMPQYLDINNNPSFMAYGEVNDTDKPDESLLLRGLQFFDKVGVNLIQFEQVFDEEGNIVAFNLKAGAIEMQKKIKH